MKKSEILKTEKTFNQLEKDFNKDVDREYKKELKYFEDRYSSAIDKDEYANNIILELEDILKKKNPEEPTLAHLHGRFHYYHREYFKNHFSHGNRIISETDVVKRRAYIEVETIFKIINHIKKKIKPIEKKNIECPGLATYLFFKTGFVPPRKADTTAWKRLATECELNFKGSTVQKQYSILKSGHKERKYRNNQKHYDDAKALFSKFPDVEGLKRLQAEIDD